MVALLNGITPDEAKRQFRPALIDMQSARAWWIQREHPSGIWCPACSHEIIAEPLIRKWWADESIHCPECGKEFNSRTGTFLSGSQLDWRQAYLILLLDAMDFSNSTIAQRIGAEAANPIENYILLLIGADHHSCLGDGGARDIVDGKRAAQRLAREVYELQNVGHPKKAVPKRVLAGGALARRGRDPSRGWQYRR